MISTKEWFVANTLQEAQLSLADRSTLLAIEYFAKSLKITQDHSKLTSLSKVYVGPY